MAFTLAGPQPEQGPLPDGEPRPVLGLLPSHRGGLDDATLQLATWLVDHSGVLKRVAEWKAAERRGPGGRPEIFPVRALLIAMAACVLTDQPLYLSRICELMFVQLTPEWRRRLDVSEPSEEGETTRENLERNVRTRFHGLIDLMDPSPTPKNRRLDDATLTRLTEQRRAERTGEQWDERYRRLEWFINQLIEASIELLPREVRRSMGSLGVDGTLVKAHSRSYKRKKGDKPKKGKKPAIEVHSVDPDAGFYVREADSRDENPDGAGKDKVAWGYEATFAVSGSEDPDAEPAYPNLIVGMGVLAKPGQSPGRHGARVLGSLHERRYQPGMLAADRAFSSAKPADFQLPALALGYQPVYDYKIDQLGVQAEYGGFLQIEGAWYSPSITQPLIDATLDYREHRIDEPIYRTRLKERRAYLARPKGKPDKEGYQRFECPAAGPWPTVRCDLKPASTTRDNRGRLHIVVSAELKANPPLSCSQKSVTIPPGAGAKFRQELHYGSPEWQSAYNSLRNTNEGMNGYIKDPAHEGLDDPSRRRIHGVAAQSVLVAFLVLAANVRKIRAFSSATPAGAPIRRKRPRRRTTEPITAWRPTMPKAAVSGDPDPPLPA